MKKFVAMMLILCLALTAVCCASAEAIVSQSAGYNPNDGYTARVDVENGMTKDSVSFTYYLDDMYKTDELAALKAGDVIKAWGEEYTVETVEPVYNEDLLVGYKINGGFIDGGLSFGLSETVDGLCYCLGYDDLCARTEAGEMTLPMAKEVIVTVYVLNDGAYDGAVESSVMPASEVQSYLLAKANTGDDTAISLDADFTIYEEDGAVVEISVNWAPNV